MDRVVDKLLAAICAAVLVLATGPSVVSVAVLLVGVSTSAACELLAGRSRWHFILESLPLVLATVLAAMGEIGAALCLVPLASYDLACMGGWLPGCAVALPLALVGRQLASLGVAACRPVAQALVTACVAAALLVMIALRTGRLARSQHRLHELRDDLQEKVLALASSRRMLEEARLVETEAATLAERARISRELHDSVGHLLTRALFQVEALVVVHEGEPRVQADLRDVGATVQEALDVTRASVHALADGAIDLDVELNRLALEAPVASVSVSCDVMAPPAANHARCLVAVCKEALTNAARHAHATHVSIRVVEHPAFWQLTVANDGDMPGPVPAIDATLLLGERGMGIRSMQERLSAFGGRLRIRYDREFVVFATIPKEER